MKRKDNYKRTPEMRQQQVDQGYFDGRFVERAETPANKYKRQNQLDIDIDYCECGNIATKLYFPYCSEECLKNSKQDD